MKYLITFFLLLGCQRKSDFILTEEVLKEDQQCSVFENGLQQYIEVSKDGTHFIKDETKAIEAISSFKLELTSSKRALKYFEKLYLDCSLVDGKRLLGCPFHQSFYSFFENLLKATKTYPWSEETKKKAIALTSSYLRFQLKEPQNLNSASIMGKIFERMSEYGYLKKDISGDVKKINTDAESFKNLQFQDLGRNGIRDCAKALENFDYEVDSGTALVEKMKNWESALP